MSAESFDDHIKFAWHPHHPILAVDFGRSVFIRDFENQSQHNIESLPKDIQVNDFAWHPSGDKLAVAYNRVGSEEREIMLLNSDELGL